MTATRTRRLLGTFRLGWLTGPIFDKELRVASRRKRNYLLRLLYLLVLSFSVVVVWIQQVESAEWGTAQAIYRMSTAGKTIVAWITGVQFVAIQFVAVIVCSTSISEEVYHGTLGVLMTTPISILQLVAGKLLSKLLTLVFLLAISLPLLAIVRVFGGVPWDYVLASACITLTAGLFAGAVAMFYSTLFRRAYASILLTLATLFVCYIVLPMILGLVLAVVSLATSSSWPMAMQLYINPYWAMGFSIGNMFDPSVGASIPFHWTLHCLIMVSFSIVVLLPCLRLVRRVALRKAIGGGDAAPVVLRAVPATAVPPPIPPAGAPLLASVAGGVARPPVYEVSGKVRRITGSPLVWKKLRTPMLPTLVLRIVAIVLTSVLVGTTLVLIGALGALDEPGVHAGYVVVYVVIGMICTTVFAATSISSEKESRSLPILLTTPLSDWHVIGACVLEVLRRSVPIWAVLVVHVLVFTAPGILHPVAALLLGALATGIVVFLTGMGLYFSACFKRTTPAVVTNLAVALGLWVILPILLSSLAGGRGSILREVSEVVSSANPVVQAAVLTNGAGDTTGIARGDDTFNWPAGDTGTAGATGIVFLALLVHCTLGLVLLWRAKIGLRRKLY